MSHTTAPAREPATSQLTIVITLDARLGTRRTTLCRLRNLCKSRGIYTGVTKPGDNTRKSLTQNNPTCVVEGQACVFRLCSAKRNVLLFVLVYWHAPSLYKAGVATLGAIISHCSFPTVTPPDGVTGIFYGCNNRSSRGFGSRKGWHSA
jgi:hypothetical protein